MIFEELEDGCIWMWLEPSFYDLHSAATVNIAASLACFSWCRRRQSVIWPVSFGNKVKYFMILPRYLQKTSCLHCYLTRDHNINLFALSFNKFNLLLLLVQSSILFWSNWELELWNCLPLWPFKEWLTSHMPWFWLEFAWTLAVLNFSCYLRYLFHKTFLKLRIG